MAPPVFKTGQFSQSAKITNKTLGCSRSRRGPNWPIEANSGHKNVYSELAVAMPLRLLADGVTDGGSQPQRFLITRRSKVQILSPQPRKPRI